MTDVSIGTSSFVSCLLPHHALDHPAVAQAEGLAQTVVQLGARIDAEEVVDGRGEVDRRDGVERGVGGVLVASTVDGAGLDAAAGQDRGEELAPVVAAVAAGA